MNHINGDPSSEFFSQPPRPRSPFVDMDNKMPVSPRYERKEDGEVEYTISFDLKDYSPDDVRIRMGDRDRIVTVDAKTSSSDGSQQKEFHHKFTLPSTVDAKRLRSVYRKDGSLSLRAPMIPPSYGTGAPASPLLRSPHLSASPQFQRSPQLPRSPHMPRSPAEFRDIPMAHSPRVQDNFFPRSPLLARSPHLASENFCSGSPSLGRNSPVFFSDFHVPIRQSNTPIPFGDRYTEEMIVDPEFQYNDFKISVRDGIVSVKAKREEQSQIREYKNEHQLPANVDGSKLTAKLMQNVLLLEAPYKMASPMPGRKFMDLPVQHD